ncbi:hypothetical protein OAN21_00250 [Alphaproteobacteria bacterium]|nr:hypothetical protein [Alphaproteobacteria bacterium]
MKIILTLALVIYSTLSFSAPWGGGSVGYNPMGGGFLTSPNPSFYRPGAGNLNPSFSYTQQQPGFQFNNMGQQQGISSSLISQKAKKIIGKWRQKVVSNQEKPEKIVSSISTITSDRRTLDSALRTRGLTPDQTNAIGQINLLLDLAEIRALEKKSKKDLERFPDDYSSSVSGKTNQKEISSYTSKRNRLAFLLKKFQSFLSRFPQYYQNPPELLIGLQDTLVAGQKAFEEYQQFSNCFSSPDLPYCAELAQKTSERGRSSRREDEEGGYEDEDLDLDDQEYQQRQYY